MGIAVLIAVACDLAFGEPKTRWHPIALIGRAMDKAGAALRARATGRTSKRAMGVLLVLAFSIASLYLSGILILGSNRLFPGFGWAANALLIWLSISVGELIIVCRKINSRLGTGKIDEARQLLRCLVGRETDDLNEQQIRTAALESLAENLVDAGIAPLFYAFIGGGPLAFTYRIINTMDSMFGYRSETYIDFGWAAARLDDVASWVPARLTVAGLALANRLRGRGFWSAVKAAVSDGGKHPSPNSGPAMAAFAGALDIQLGGQRLYEGIPVVYGYFGADIKRIDADMVDAAAGLAARTFVTLAALGVLVAMSFQGVSWLIG
ncbi:MAG: adenosylcobinamide-phosphate synthase CbiB [Actinomycetota bacterium]|nr:adenosylcobinamide-phosphate synthase CbiB [Actinomycetota bacterium]